jgi:hypothetical protein
LRRAEGRPQFGQGQGWSSIWTFFGCIPPMKMKAHLPEMPKTQKDGLVKSPSVPLGAGLRCNFVAAAHP